MLSKEIRDKREVISDSNGISIVIYNTNYVDVLQENNGVMIQTTLYDFKRWLNTTLGGLV